MGHTSLIWTVQFKTLSIFRFWFRDGRQECQLYKNGCFASSGQSQNLWDTGKWNCTKGQRETKIKKFLSCTLLTLIHMAWEGNKHPNMYRFTVGHYWDKKIRINGKYTRNLICTYHFLFTTFLAKIVSGVHY